MLASLQGILYAGLLPAVFALAFASLGGRRWCLIAAAVVSLIHVAVFQYQFSWMQDAQAYSGYSAMSLWNGIAASLQLLALPLSAVAVPWALAKERSSGVAGSEATRPSLELRRIAMFATVVCILLWVLLAVVAPPIAKLSLLVQVWGICFAATALARWVVRASAIEALLAAMGTAIFLSAIMQTTPATKFGTYGLVHQMLPYFLAATHALAAGIVFALVATFSRSRSATLKASPG